MYIFVHPFALIFSPLIYHMVISSTRLLSSSMYSKNECVICIHIQGKPTYDIDLFCGHNMT